MVKHPFRNQLKIAVVGHFFYTEQVPAIVSYLRNIPRAFDLFISVPTGKKEALERIFVAAFPGRKRTLREVVNRGFDIAPFLCSFQDVYSSYDLVLKIHSKKSAHTFCLKTWGDYLLKNAVGSPETVETILKMFEEDPQLGLIYPEMIPIFKKELMKDPWQGNWRLCRTLGERLGLLIGEEKAPEFPAGSMFWFRPKALEPLLRLGLSLEDFPEGKHFHRNGTLAHAIERLFVLIARKQGFSTREVLFWPFQGVYDSSFWGRVRNAACCEWERFLHGLRAPS